MNYTIRPIGPEDAEGAAALRRMPGVFENTLGLPSYRTADSKAFIAGLGPDDHNFVAVLDDGTVIGCAGLTVCSNPRMRHAGSVGLYVHTDYQNKGVGTALMETLLDLADNWLMLVRVELEVYADNERATISMRVSGGAFMNYTIRPIGPEDAEGAAALRRMPGVFENTLGLPSYRTADSKAFIAGLGPDDHNFVAVLDDGTVIGCAGLTVCSNPRMRHAGSVGLYVHTDYQNKGVGTALMETLLDLADNWLMLVRVELEVYADNERAIHLYEKLGFEQEGLLRMTTVRNGRYVDEYKMARIRPGVTAP